MEKDHEQAWRTKLHDTIYESNTKAGKAFDVALLVFILASILVVMLDSISYYHKLMDIFFIFSNGSSRPCLLSNIFYAW
jgi:voltage-gated potassium channel